MRTHARLAAVAGEDVARKDLRMNPSCKEIALVTKMMAKAVTERKKVDATLLPLTHSRERAPRKRQWRAV